MNDLFAHPPVLGFAAWSGTGKTTLLTRLLPLLRERGLRIGMIKHAHHGFDVDTPGKDSYELRKAGAEQVLVASRQRWALMVERTRNEDPRLEELLTHFDRTSLDLILVEGFKHLSFPKIELHRAALEKPLLFTGDNSIIAVACDQPVTTGLPTLDLNDLRAIADFVIEYANRTGRTGSTHRTQGGHHD
ncbi:MAG: molybdopterin-guanine dinucleotide biosynthesis protein MobB [Gammaproteobacteria bacterium]